ncbi:MAG: LysE family transporter [Gammaproteobacteria bacterium]|nr:LysE family transporter [Gammaproteobacteria bacterium]MDE2250760.1 LysE family transporter [Gammaproteobacteria bacterium]
MLALLGKGLVLGFSIAAPVGPIGLLCIRRSLSTGRLAGLATGMGAATADACYGAVAAFGLTRVTSLMVGARTWLTLVGGLFLCWLGARIMRIHPDLAVGREADSWAHGAYLGALIITLTNPLTILAFLGAFAGLGLAVAHDYLGATVLVAGVFVGSGIWWLILSGFAARMRDRFDPRWLQRVNWVSGALLILVGLGALLSLRRWVLR